MTNGRRSRLPVRAWAPTQRLSRERIIPGPRMAQTLRMVATAVMVRGSFLMALLVLPLMAIPAFRSPQVLPFLAFLVTASHGSLLVRRWIRSR